jgi:hypothetical protein
VIEARVAFEHGLTADVSLPCERYRKHRVTHRRAFAQSLAAAARTFEIARGEARTQRDRAVQLLLVEAKDFGSCDRRAENREHRSGMKTPRHDGRNEVRCHALHDFVACSDAREVVLARSRRGFRRGEPGGNDRRAGMREHAERVPLPARESHFRIGERGAALGHLRAVHHDGDPVTNAAFFVDDHLHGLLAGFRLRADQHGSEGVKRHPFRAVDDFRRKVFETQCRDPLGELSAE